MVVTTLQKCVIFLHKTWIKSSTIQFANHIFGVPISFRVCNVSFWTEAALESAPSLLHTKSWKWPFYEMMMLWHLRSLCVSQIKRMFCGMGKMGIPRMPHHSNGLKKMKVSSHNCYYNIWLDISYNLFVFFSSWLTVVDKHAMQYVQ